MRSTTVRKGLAFFALMAVVISLTSTYAFAGLTAAETAALGDSAQETDTDASQEAALTVGTSAEDDPVPVDSWDGLQSEINNADGNLTVRLTTDVTDANNKGRIIVKGKNKSVTIDLNGFALNRNLTSQADNGSVIEVSDKATLTIKDGSAANGSLGNGTITGGYPKKGGGIYVDEGAMLNIESGTIADNHANENGGGIYVKGSLKMTGGTIARNHATGDGGGIYVLGTLTIEGGTISGNDAGKSGGGIFVGSTGNAKLSNAVIKQNKALRLDGGGINLKPLHDSSIENCTIISNNCGRNGGGLGLDSKYGTLTISGTSIKSNESTSDGGGMYLYKGTVSMSDGLITGNTSSEGGGGVAVASDATFTANEVTISSNEAQTKEGGGIKNLGTTTLTDCTISDNNATTSNGGGVYSNKTLALVGGKIGISKSADGSNVEGNRAVKGAGVFIAKDAKLTSIEGDLRVDANVSLSDGKEIYLCNGQKLALSGPITGAQMGVTMEHGLGTFTTGYGTFSRADDPASHFYSPEGFDIGLDQSQNEVQIASYWSDLENEIEKAEENDTVLVLHNCRAAYSNDGLVISKSLTINLAGHTLDRNLTSSEPGLARSSVIRVTGNATLTIVDLSSGKTGKITGGFADYGGGIYVDKGSTLVFKSGNITKNKANVDGGGIYVKGTLKMMGGTAEGNDGDGSGDAEEGNDGDKSSGTIEGNNALRSGGGICVDPAGEVYLSGATITNNTAENLVGGGMSVKSQKDSTITDCTITNNEAGSEGGGLYVESKDKTLAIKKTIIDGNESSHDGGGLYLNKGTVSMTDGSLSGNTSHHGAGVSISSDAAFSANHVAINNNIAEKEQGGGVKNQGTTTLENCTVSGNHAKRQGGGIYSEKTLTIIGGTIGKSVSGSGAEAITIPGNSVEEEYGGGIFIAKGAKATNIKDTIIAKGNTGKDIYLQTGQKLTLTDYIGETEIGNLDMQAVGVFTIGFGAKYLSGDSAKDPGEFFNVDTGAIPVERTKDGEEVQLVSTWPGLQQQIKEAEDDPSKNPVTLYKDYTAGSSDTSLKVTKDVKINLNGHTLNRNLTSEKDDGNVIEVQGNATLTIVDEKGEDAGEGPGMITGGYAQYGGGIRVKEGTLKLVGGTIADNTASKKGGGIYVDKKADESAGKNALLSLEGGTIKDNTSNDEGGGVYIDEKATFNFKSGTIEGNTASGDGGGVYAKGALNMTGGTIEGNIAGRSGGGIYIDPAGEVSLSKAAITNNTAKKFDGGGMNNKSQKDSTITDCTITDNTASRDGGGLSVDSKGKTLTIEGTAVDGNSSGGDGGGLYLYRGTVAMNKNSSSGIACSLSYNVSDNSGGGACAMPATTFTMDNGVISGNQALGADGGGVKNQGTTRLSNCTGSGNSANRGGGFFNDDDGEGNLTLANCEVSKNKAAFCGGGVYTNNKLALSSCRISENNAKEGGGIFVGSDTATSSSTGSATTTLEGLIQVEDNEASFYGNNVYLREEQKLALTGALDNGTKIGVDVENGSGELTKGYQDYNNGHAPEEYFVVAKGFALDIVDREVHISSNWTSLMNIVEHAKYGEVITLDRDYVAGMGDTRIRIWDGKNVTINLNGHTVNRNRACHYKDEMTSSENDRLGAAFEVLDKGTLTITDTSTDGAGIITGGWTLLGGAIFVDSGGTLNLKGGTITGNRASKDGGGIYVQGTLNMAGGAVKANTAEGSGGGIVMDANSTLNFTGGTITGNEAGDRGGGIMIVDGAHVSIQENPVVLDNDAAVVGTDIYLPSYNRLSISGTLGDDAQIGIALEEEQGVFTSQYDRFNKGKDPARFFTSTQGYAVVAQDGEAALGEDTHGDTDYAKPFIDRNSQININTNALSGQNWMAGISGERYLHEINMPGSHDSGMKNVQPLGWMLDTTATWALLAPSVSAYFAMTQVEYIDQQLEEGARQFDIRLNNYYKKKTTYAGVYHPYTWDDDGTNLWICHGTDKNGGTYHASNSDDKYLSFSQVLGWVKNFLKKHPTETVILNIRPETCVSGQSDAIYQRARKILDVLATQTNPSTGEPYLYRESGSSSYFAKYKRMPQLKDCRGKIVLLPGDDTGLDIVGGFRGNSFDSITYKDPVTYKLTASEKIVEVPREYGKLNDGSVKLPANANEHCDSLWYWELNCTGEDQGNWNYFVGLFYAKGMKPGDVVPFEELAKHTHELGLNPIMIANTVNPTLVGSGKLFGPEKAGQYIGWVRMDAFEAKFAEAIWRTNFFKAQQYCTVTVESGLGGPYVTQTYDVLKGTSIEIPGNIYKQLPQGKHLSVWKAAGENTDTTCYPGETFTINEDVTFTAKWLEDGQIPVSIVWEDADNVGNLRPQSVDLVVTAEDGTTTRVTLTGDEGWTGAVENTVKSVVPDWDAIGQDDSEHYRYDAVIDKASGVVLTFYHTPQVMVTAEGTINWDDSNNADGLRPESVTIRLLANGSEASSKTVTAGNEWQYGFGELPQYVNGERVEYGVIEDDIEGYETFVNDFFITNKHVAGKQNVTDVTGVVIWNDADDEREVRPEKIRVHLKGNDEEVGSREVSAGDHSLWEFNFEEVSINDSQGQPIAYSIIVDEVPNYTSTVDVLGTYVFSVTNTLDIPDDQKEPAEIERAPEAIKLTYVGEAQSLVKKGFGSGGTMMYALGADDETAPSTGFDEELPTGIDAGTYRVWYYVKGDVFHKDTEPVCLTATIGKRPVTFAGDVDTERYTGSEIGIAGVRADGLVKGHRHNVRFTAYGTEVGGPYEGSITAKDEVVIKSSGVDVTTNYEVTVVPGGLTIQQNPDKELRVSLEGESYTYDGKPHTLAVGATTNALSGQTKVEYSKDGEAWTEDLSSLTATGVADSCTVRVRATNPNYANIAECDAKLTIGPAMATITVDNASKIQYEDDPTFTGKVEGLVAAGDLGDVSYERTNVDEAPNTYRGALTAKYTANDNYKVTVKNGDFTIKKLLAVVWLDGDGSELARKDYGEGDPAPVYGGKKPTKAATAQYTFAFSGWDDGVVEGATTTYKPLFSKAVNKCTVRFVDEDGTELQSDKVAYGQTPAYSGKTPTKMADASYTYKFAGWTPKIAPVTSEVTYKATYAKAPKLGRPRIYSVFASAKSSATAVWAAVSNARSYELQWRVGRGSWHSFAVKGTSKAIKGLKSGKLYQFRVRAVASSVKGAWSNVSGRYYQTVSLKSIKRVGAGAVSAVWRADPKANAGYAVIVRDKFGGKVLARKVVSAGVTSATVRGLAPGKRVWVRVRSLRTEGVLTYVGVLSAGRYVRL